MNESVKKDLAEAREICPTTARRLLAEGALLVDVREADEVAQVGFGDCEILHIPLSEFETRWTEVPRDRDAVLACAAGMRSLKATYFLMYQGYDRISNMQYGMQRWVARGFPITGNAAAISTNTGSCCGTDEAKPAASSCCGNDAPAASVASCCADTPATDAGCGCSETNHACY